MTSSTPCLALGFIITVAGSACHILGTVLPEWESNGKMEKGLFEVCFKDNDSCVDLDDLSTEELIVQVLALVGVATSGLGILGVCAFFLISMLGRAPGRMLIIVSSLLCMLAFACAGASVVYWTEEIHDDDQNDLDLCFYLSSVGAPVIGIGGLFIMFSAKYVTPAASDDQKAKMRKPC